MLSPTSDPFSLYHWQGSSGKKVMLEYNKNYVTLALNCILKNSKRIL